MSSPGLDRLGPVAVALCGGAPGVALGNAVARGGATGVALGNAVAGGGAPGVKVGRSNLDGVPPPPPPKRLIIPPNFAIPPPLFESVTFSVGALVKDAGLAGITILSLPRSLLAGGALFMISGCLVGTAIGGRLAACACAILSSPGLGLGLLGGFTIFFVAMLYSWRFWWSSRSPHLICNKFLRNLRYHTFHCHPHFRGHYLRRHCSWPHTQLWHCSTLLWQGGHC